MEKFGLYKRYLFIILLSIIAFPLAGNLYEFVFFDGEQKSSERYHVNRQLRGSYILHTMPEFNTQSWFSGNFQDTANLYIEENILFRNLFVRIYNHLNFSLFQKIHPDVIIGKQGILFEKMDIQISRGMEYQGRNTLYKKLESVKEIQNFLRSKGKYLLIVFAPSKSIVEENHLPDYIDRWKLDTSNYTTLTKGCDALGIHYIDMSQYFLACKDTAAYRLYPELGSHWTSYGMALAADTIFNKLEELSGHNIRDFKIDTVITALHPSQAGIDYNSQDYDLTEMLNLIEDLEQDPLPYPHFTFSAEKPSHNLLFAGDSYYWQLYLSGIVDSVFQSHSFWFYNSTVYEKGQQYRANDTLFTQKLSEADFIVIMQGTGGLRDLGFGLIEKVLALNKKKEPQGI